MAADDSGPKRFEILGRIAGWTPDFENSAQLWLTNFDVRDRSAATALLDAFVYLDSKVVDAMFSSAFGFTCQRCLSGVRLCGCDIGLAHIRRIGLSDDTHRRNAESNRQWLLVPAEDPPDHGD